jgi:hypothetical protein
MSQKEIILKHIKASRMWLDKAEKWIENNNLIKGILTLLLASAEIQRPLRNLEEVKVKDYQIKTRYIRYYVPSMIAASFLIISIFTYFYFKNNTLVRVTEKPKIQEKIESVIPSSTAKEILKKEEPGNKIIVKVEKKGEILKTAKKAKISSKFTKRLPSKEYTLSQEKKKEISSFDTDLIEMVRIAEKTLREGVE